MKRVTKGSTIIEVLIAATLISTAILASLALSTASQRQTDFSHDVNLATIYNNQAVDYFRNLRTSLGWQGLVNELDLDTSTDTVTYCLQDLPADTATFVALTASVCDASNINDHLSGTNLFREVSLTMSGSPVDTIRVLATTYWAGKTHQATTEATLTEW